MTVRQILLALVLAIVAFIVVMPSQECAADEVRILMAPGDYCVLAPHSTACGGHVDDFATAHHRVTCVKRASFVTLWKRGFCHHSDGTPILSPEGLTLCKPDVRHITSSELTQYPGIEDVRIREGEPWYGILINGYPLGYRAVSYSGARFVRVWPETIPVLKNSLKNTLFVRDLQGVNKNEFDLMILNSGIHTWWSPDERKAWAKLKPFGF